jgi:hypothetical protein
MIDTERGSPDFNPNDAGASFEHEMMDEPNAAPTPAEPAPTPPAPTEERSADEALSGPSRDPQGRFAKPAPPVEPVPAPAGAAPAAPPAQPTASTEAPAPPVAEPLPEASYRADGNDFAIPGSQHGEDGVFIPTEQWDQVQRLIGQGQVHQGSFQKRLSESAQSVQREKTRADAAEASKAAVFDRLVTMMQDGSIEDWLGEMRTNLPVLLAKAEEEGAKLRIKEYEEREAARERETTESQREPQMETALSNAILHYGAKANLSQDRMRQLYTRLNTPEYRRALFFEATEDDPIQGIRKGETVIALGLVEDMVAGAGTQAGVEKVAAAAAQNAKAAGTSAVPPTVGAGAGPAPRTVAPAKQFKNAAEADEHIWSDEGFAALGKR